MITVILSDLSPDRAEEAETVPDGSLTVMAPACSATEIRIRV